MVLYCVILCYDEWLDVVGCLWCHCNVCTDVFTCVILFMSARACACMRSMFIQLSMIVVVIHYLFDKHALAAMHSIFSRKLFELVITLVRIAKCFGNQSNFITGCLFLD